MLGLKRVLFPVSSPESSIEIVTQKRQRITSSLDQGLKPRVQQRPLNCSAHSHSRAVLTGGVLASITDKDMERARRGRLTRESKRRRGDRTSKAVGSILMNLEYVGKINKDNQNNLGERKPRPPEMRTIPMGCLMEVTQLRNRSTQPFVSHTAGRRRSRTSLRQMKTKANRKNHINAAPKRLSRRNLFLSSVDSLILCSTSQMRSKIAPITSSVSRECTFEKKSTSKSNSAGNSNRPRGALRLLPKKSTKRTEDTNTKQCLMQEDSSPNKPQNESTGESLITSATLEGGQGHDLNFSQPLRRHVSTSGSHNPTKEEVCGTIDESGSKALSPPPIISIPISSTTSTGSSRAKKNNACTKFGSPLPRETECSDDSSAEDVAASITPLTALYQIGRTAYTVDKMITNDLREDLTTTQPSIADVIAPIVENAARTENPEGLNRCRQSFKLADENPVSLKTQESRDGKRLKQSVLERRRSMRNPQKENKLDKEDENGLKYPRRSKRNRSRPHWFGRQFDNKTANEKNHREDSLNYPIGTKVRKLFDMQDWIEGEVVPIDVETALYKIKYEDGDSKDVDEDELRVYVKRREDVKQQHSSKSENGKSNDEGHVSSEDGKKTCEPETTVSSHSEFEEDDLFNATPLRRILIGNDSEDGTKDEMLTASTADCNNKMLVRDEDDIFEGTPSHDFNWDDADEVNGQKIQDLEENKSTVSKRTRKPPKRFGAYEKDIEEACPPVNQFAPTKSSPKKTKRMTKNGKKDRVDTVAQIKLIENERGQKGEEKNTQEWTSAELQALLSAHRNVNPQSICFWEDISSFVSTKSSEECMEKWFSLAKTPLVKKKDNEKKVKGSGTPLYESHLHASEDDIFNATPMRGIFQTSEDRDGDASIDLRQLEQISRMATGIEVKVFESQGIDEGGLDSQKCKQPQGYKTYIQQIGRNMRQKEHRAQRVKQCSAYTLSYGKHLQERSSNGDYEINCRLSPGGTIQMKTSDGALTDDYFEEENEGDGESAVA
ncbi:Myb-like DNA-binding protein [Nitzschia inconspicua]|uniref:Myb-like DNA-binding protein n=1 Tax=Nitzschia inconspicua TaxID=303405 RepID=A0A9K3PTT8_9STRA|nr:Myb-like DNA-binding protein [Nitzschia inconspicua]